MNYPHNIEQKIGFDKIRAKLEANCLGSLGKELVGKIQYSVISEEIRMWLDQTSEFVDILNGDQEFPIDNYTDIRPVLERIRPEGMFPEASEILQLRKSLQTMKAIRSFFNSDNKEKFPQMAKLGAQFNIYPYVFERIDRVISSNGRVKDNASVELKEIRQFIDKERSRVSKLMHQILAKAKKSGYIDDDENVTIRDGRLMLPLKSNARRRIQGIVHDESATGKTVYLEPAEIIEINNDIRDAEYREKREVIRILIDFANDIRPYCPELIESYNQLAIFDFIRAKAKLAIQLNGIKIKVDDNPEMSFRKAVNPLLFMSFQGTNRRVIPNDFELNENQRILLISGPNAGGKSVAMKTAGLLQFMIQCGLLIPVDQDSSTGIFDQIFMDIGDDQSIDNDLSTYSSHLMHMKHMLKKATRNTLILIDEFGSGTEPVIGGAIAEAVLDKFNRKGVYGVVTTHYSNLKHYAANTDSIINGAMLFDTGQIRPVYKLEPGKPGSSFAIEIAHKAGLPDDVIEDAKKRAGTDQTNFDKHLREIARDKKYYAEKRSKIKRAEKQLESMLEKQSDELEKAKKMRAKVIDEAEKKAKAIIEGSNKLIEKTIREIKEAKADKEKTRKIRESFKEDQERLEKNSTVENSDLSTQINKVKQVSKKYNLHIDKQDVQKEGLNKITKGCLVKLKGQGTIGEVVECNDKNAYVAFGSFMTSVETDKLEICSKNEAKRTQKSYGRSVQLVKKKNNFKPGIDLRGKYPDEALQLLTEYIDEAIVVGVSQVKILHGKGSGVLRKVIREYLSTIPEITSLADEHVDFGGAGITVVTFS